MHGQYEFIGISILAGVVGWVYSVKLTDADMILNWWYLICDQRLPKWISKPICTCYKCVSGQIGLWTYVAISWTSEVNYSQVFFCVSSVCISILTSLFINDKLGEKA